MTKMLIIMFCQVCTLAEIFFSEDWDLEKHKGSICAFCGSNITFANTWGDVKNQGVMGGAGMMGQPINKFDLPMGGRMAIINHMPTIKERL